MAHVNKGLMFKVQELTRKHLRIFGTNLVGLSTGRVQVLSGIVCSIPLRRHSAQVS